MVEGISANTSTQTGQTTKTTKPVTQKSSNENNREMQKLSEQIIDPPSSVQDLKHNKEIKEKQITLAKQMGNSELVQTLQTELNEIINDIKKNETSIFNN